MRDELLGEIHRTPIMQRLYQRFWVETSLRAHKFKLSEEQEKSDGRHGLGQGIVFVILALQLTPSFLGYWANGISLLAAAASFWLTYQSRLCRRTYARYAELYAAEAEIWHDATLGETPHQEIQARIDALREEADSEARKLGISQGSSIAPAPQSPAADS